MEITLDIESRDEAIRLFGLGDRNLKLIRDALPVNLSARNGTLRIVGEKHAVEAAAEYLYDANMPLVYGLSNVTCETQRRAVALAELVGGVVDSHTSL